MDRSIGSNIDAFPEDLLSTSREVTSLEVPPIPEGHPAEPDVFARHEGVPGHSQTILKTLRAFLVGGGGLNSWTALAMARTGTNSIIIADDDLIDRTNLSRQLYFANDMGHRKGERLARNIAPHVTDGAHVTGIPLRFEDVIDEFAVSTDILIVGVDNNSCRLRCVQEAKKRQIPAVFTMLSRDGMRCQCFLQGPLLSDPCLWCALPNLDPESSSPCASAIISSCFLATAFTLFFVHRAVMGWPDKVEPFNWRESDLLGIVPDAVGMIARRSDCPVCN